MKSIIFSILCGGLAVYANPVIGATIDFPSDPSEWIATDPPTKRSDQWYTANASTNTWQVTKKDNNNRVKVWRPQQKSSSLPFNPREATGEIEVPGIPSVMKVSNGWIVGFAGGEWGGELWWFAPRGSEHYKISDDQVHHFVETEVGLLALEGLDHRSRSKGKVIKVNRTESGRWKVEQFVDLGAAPRTFLQQADGDLLVVTTDQLLRVGLDRSLEVLVDDAFWGGLQPTSIVRGSDGKIYIGMRRGIARITPKKTRRLLVFQKTVYQVDWLLPDRSWLEPKP